MFKLMLMIVKRASSILASVPLATELERWHLSQTVAHNTLHATNATALDCAPSATVQVDKAATQKAIQDTRAHQTTQDITTHLEIGTMITSPKAQSR